MRLQLIQAMAGLTMMAGCAYTGPMYFSPPDPAFAARVPAHVEPRVQTYVYAQVLTTLNGAYVSGATCGLTSREVDLGFQTPAQIDVPVYHRPPPPAQLTCTYGDKTVTRLIHARKIAEIPGDPGTRPVDVFLSFMTNAVADSLDLWTYVRQGDRLTVALDG